MTPDIVPLEVLTKAYENAAFAPGGCACNGCVVRFITRTLPKMTGVTLFKRGSGALKALEAALNDGVSFRLVDKTRLAPDGETAYITHIYRMKYDARPHSYFAIKSVERAGEPTRFAPAYVYTGHCSVVHGTISYADNKFIPDYCA